MDNEANSTPNAVQLLSGVTNQMVNIKKTILAVVATGLLWTTLGTAEEQRYISIRNTGSSWAQGMCFLQFNLDNGGMGEFANLYITLQLTDKQGKALIEGTLKVPPFGDSSATRSVNAILEADCDAVENADSIAIIQASEDNGNNVVSRLPVSTFNPQYYQPLKITVGGS